MNLQLIPEPQLNFSSEEQKKDGLFVFGDQRNYQTPNNRRKYKSRKTQSPDDSVSTDSPKTGEAATNENDENTVSDSLAEFVQNEAKGELLVIASVR